MTKALDTYKKWIDSEDIDDSTREELLGIENDTKEIEERFYADLDFGTAGLRGILGAGTNRMNVYTAALATAGYGKVIAKRGKDAIERGVAVSYDTRICSDEFAEMAVRVLCSMGIKVYLTEEGRPVPVLSYSIRKYGCIGGIMITASHNPSKYNGLKVYGEDGSQLNPDDAKKVKMEMENIVDGFALTKSLTTLDSFHDQCAVEYMGENLDKSYTEMLLGLSINPEIVKKHADMKIVYSPLNGTGNKPVRRVLKELGFNNVMVVPEQEHPDGRFPTVEVPNPELRETMELSIKLAEKTQASLVIATDPDSDRTGLCVRDDKGKYRVLTGNQIALLLMEYILDSKASRGELPENSFCVSTIVSTKLARTICEYYGVVLYEVLTGFKYIGEKIKDLDEFGEQHFQFGFEESFGYLAGTDVRDKDAVVASMLLSEMAAVSMEKGETLFDRLEKIYEKFGYAAEKTVAITREGMEGKKKIESALVNLRKDFKLEGVVAVKDYLDGYKCIIATGEKEKLDLPSSNVLIYEMEGIDWLCVRPSGTEPKLKIYFGFYGDNKAAAENKLERISKAVIDRIQEELKGE